jgi:hypothetical protein
MSAKASRSCARKKVHGRGTGLHGLVAGSWGRNVELRDRTILTAFYRTATLTWIDAGFGSRLSGVEYAATLFFLDDCSTAIGNSPYRRDRQIALENTER